MGQAFSRGRRRFIQASAAVGGGLLIGLYLPSASSATQPQAGPTTFAPNAWIRIGADNRVTILVARSEMGQGVATSLPTLVAEELEVDLAQINVEMAPAAPVYINPMLGMQLTGGSTSVRSAWEPLR